jgi:hypothetical protein
MITAWLSYKAKVSGAVTKRVTCEKCSCAYAYEMVRQARGAGTSLYFLDNAGAENRAYAQANKRLRRAFERGVEPVACPDCGWFQSEMVEEARRRTLRVMKPIAIVALALAGFYGSMAVLALAVGAGRSPDVKWWEAIIIPGGLAAVGLLLLGIRYAVVRGVDPNRGFPDRPAAYPGAPIGHKVKAVAGAGVQQQRLDRAGAAVGAYPVPPPRSLKPSSKAPRRAPGAK